MRLCVRWLHGCAGEEKRTLRKSAFCVRALTEKRILCRRRHGKAHSGRATSRKSAFCVRSSPKSALCMRAVVAPRGYFRRSVYTPASHGRSHDRAGPWVPRRRRPHGPRDARALEPEAHATGAVTQPPTHTNSRSPPLACKKASCHPAAPYAPGLPSLLSRRALTWRRSCLSSLDASCIWSLTASWPVPP